MRTSQYVIKMPKINAVPTTKNPTPIPEEMYEWMKSPHLHSKVMVNMKRLCVHRFGGKISVLLCRWYVSNLELPASSMLPNGMMTDINVHTVRSGHRVAPPRYCLLVFVLHRGTPNTAIRVNLLRGTAPETPRVNTRSQCHKLNFRVRK